MRAASNSVSESPGQVKKKTSTALAVPQPLQSQPTVAIEHGSQNNPSQDSTAVSSSTSLQLPPPQSASHTAQPGTRPAPSHEHSNSPSLQLPPPSAPQPAPSHEHPISRPQPAALGTSSLTFSSRYTLTKHSIHVDRQPLLPSEYQAPYGLDEGLLVLRVFARKKY